MAEKFWFIQDIEHFLTTRGLSLELSGGISFLAGCVILLMAVYVLDFLGNKLILRLIHIRVKHTTTLWDDYLAEHGFFRRLIRLIFALFIALFMEVIFSGFSDKIVTIGKTVVECSIIVLFMMLLYAIIDAGQDVYNTKPQSREKSIKGYLQVIKIVLVFISGILIISKLVGKDPAGLLAGMAASAAILSLVFKDTILGFVASIQLSAQDMVRLGDWIEMPSKRADGNVVEINVNTVKVQNWDNTVTMIPIYSLVSESFVNWRAMEQSTGRRFTRRFFLDLSTISFLEQTDLVTLREHAVVSTLYEEMVVLHDRLVERSSTNLGYFRAYLECYIRGHRKINPKLTLLVRYLPQSENGIALEIYAFSTEKGFVEYENFLSEMMEHIIAVTPVFGLRLYQRPSGYDAVRSKN